MLTLVRILVLYLLVVRAVLCGEYPIWYRQYAGRTNVTMCWSTLDGGGSDLYDCSEYYPFPVDLYMPLDLPPWRRHTCVARAL